MTAVVALLGIAFGASVSLAVTLAGRPARSGPEVRVGRPRDWTGRFERLPLRAGLALGAAVLVSAWTRWPVAALLAAAGGFAMPDYGRRQAQIRTHLARLEAIAGWAEMLRDTLSAAAGLQQAIRATAPLAPAPVRAEVLALVRAVEQQHIPLQQGLGRLADDLDDPTGDLVVAALQLAARRQPGQLSNLLGSLAEAARAEVTMRQRIEAGRARIRSSVRIISIFIVAFTGVLLMLNAAYLSAYRTVGGQAVLALVAGLDLLAYYWLARDSRLVRPARTLVGHPAGVPV